MDSNSARLSLGNPHPQQHYVLYHNPFSICSLQVRLSILFGSHGGPKVPGIQFEELEIDIYRSEQLEEFFLCGVNPKGQV